MAEIFGYSIAGGGGGTGATLTVTGVAGSTVTASKESKTYTRTLDSNGKAVFKGLSSGTWTLTMTDGTQTATRSVDVVADYDMAIAYQLVLFDNGDNTAVTEGWLTKAWGLNAEFPTPQQVTADLTKERIYIYGNGASGIASGCAYIKKKLDLSQYKTLIADFEATNTSGQTSIRIFNSLDTAYMVDAIVATITPETTDRGVHRLDISALTGEYFIGANILSADTSRYIKIYSLILE